jgi:hypothetical protein
MTEEQIMDAIYERGEMNSDWVLIRKTLNDADGIALPDRKADYSLFVEIMAVGAKCKVFRPEMAAFSRDDGVTFGETAFCPENPFTLQFFGTLNDEIGKIDQSYWIVREPDLYPVLFHDDGKVKVEALSDYVTFEAKLGDDEKDGIALLDRALRLDDAAIVHSAGNDCAILKVGDAIILPKDYLCVGSGPEKYGFAPESDVLGRME